MPNLPISGLPPLVGNATDTDPVAIVQGGITLKGRLDQLGLLQASENLNDVSDKNISLENIGQGDYATSYPNQTTDLTLTNPMPYELSVEMNDSSHSVILPVFNEDTSIRRAFLVYNTGTDSFSLKKNDGTSIATINPGQFAHCFVHSNDANPTIEVIQGTDIGDLGTMAYQNSGAVDITGGTETGVTYDVMTMADGGVIRASSGSSNHFQMQAYDGNISSYVSFFDLSSGLAPTLALSKPTNGLLQFFGADHIGGSISTFVNNGNTQIFEVYDVDGSAYKTFATMTAANTPLMAFVQPSGGLLTWDGGAIGGVTPAAGTFTTLYADSLSLSLLNPLSQLYGGTGNTNPYIIVGVNNATGGPLAVGTTTIIDNSATPSSASLPTTCALYEKFRVTCVGSGGVTITQAVNQQMLLAGGAATTSGTGGSISTGNGAYALSTIVFECVQVNTVFQAISFTGLWTVV